ncbi:MAG: hypothetical protein Q9195_001012 [Heterodermia aff. obscurata]
MASFRTVPRELARISSRPLRYNGTSRGFRSQQRALAAQNLTMPAMSPTMTEGNIASWKVKEGESFTAGDVLLEVETDKAQMDVEAQDDGIMASITQPDGAKGIKVGTRIAVIADADDDLSTLSLPADDALSASASSPQEATRSGIDSATSSESQAEAPPSSKGEDVSFSSDPKGSQSPKTSSRSASQSSARNPSQTYPLYPSITQLLHEKGIPASDADQIPASGPKGRLLKGDVLAYLGTISKSYSSDQSNRITKLGHLDLSNIQIASLKAAPPPAVTTASAKAISASIEEPDSEIAVTISLSSVLEVQKRVHTTLGITLPLSTFIARATEIANDDLPRSSTTRPTPDELFNSVLGLEELGSKSSRGSFTPQITALPPAPMISRLAPSNSSRQPDVIDILTGQPLATTRKGLPKPPRSVVAGPTQGAPTNVFSLSVSKGEEKRAKVFLERVKTILQIEPGRLII